MRRKACGLPDAGIGGPDMSAARREYEKGTLG